MLLLLLLLMWPVFLFLVINLLFLPFHFALYSLVNIVTVPFQLIKIAFNKQLRRNHALEHATINVIEEHYGRHNLAGLAQENGFIIQGAVAPQLLEKASRIGLARLQDGEEHLAIHERCGTSMLAANFIAMVIFILLLWQIGYFNIFNFFLALLLAQAIGPSAGRLLQRYVTTSPDVHDMEIAGVEYYRATGFYLTPLSQGRFFVRTRRVLVI